MIPGQGERRCPNCGNPVPAELPRCSVCGYDGKTVRRASKAPVVVVFFLIGVPAGLAGGAMLLIRPWSVDRIIQGVTWITLFFALLWIFVNTMGSRR